MQERFESVLTQNRPRLLRQAQSLCAARSDAEDLVQEVFLRFVSTFKDDPLPDEGRCTAWLATTLTNLFISHLRKAQVQRRAHEDPLLQDSLAGPPDGAPAPLFETITAEQLEGAVGVLSPKLRETFEASASGKRYDEIAELLGIARGAVAKRLHDARRRLRKELLAHHRPEGSAP